MANVSGSEPLCAGKPGAEVFWGLPACMTEVAKAEDALRVTQAEDNMWTYSNTMCRMVSPEHVGESLACYCMIDGNQ